MSDLSAAAAAMGVPEAIAERSARARAEATGQTYEEVLAAWASGEAPAAGSAPPPPSEAPAETPPESPDQAAEAPAAAPPEAAAPLETPAADPPSPAPAGGEMPALTTLGPPPILDATPDRPLLTILGGVGVLVMALLVAFVLPALPAESNEVRSSNFPLTDIAIEGRSIYRSAGCASCHTQYIRGVVADFGLGPVTLGDSNQVLGYRRVGPDLANAGGRLTAEQVAAVVTGGAHPPVALSTEDVSSIASYLSETGVAFGGGDS